MEEDTRYDSEFEYEDYPEYPPPGVGLSSGQLALIIGVNAVISLVISIIVVLIANRQPLPADVSAQFTATGEPVSQDQPAATEAGQPPGESAAPEATPLESVTYVVEAGDTLSQIATQFAIPLSDLMIANGLTNKDLIQVGQELVIPIGGLPTATPTFTAVPVPTDTPLPFNPPTPLPTDAELPQEPAATVGPSPTPTETPLPTATSTPTPIPTSTPAPFDEINVVISEVNNPGELMQETLVLLNQGAGTSLKDWQLEGSPLGIIAFPDILLFSGGSIRIHTAAGQNTSSDLYLGQGEPAWPPGTTMILLDDKNNEIDRFTVPED